MDSSYCLEVNDGFNCIALGNCIFEITLHKNKHLILKTPTSYTINCKGTLVSLAKTKVMGILNLTPDSFYDGGKHNLMDSALKQTEKMLQEGATFIDVGGMSTRPGAAEISTSEELKRTIPAIEKIGIQFPEAYISIDTYRSEVAKHALEAGAALINDVSGGDADENMFQTVAAFQCPYILMHMQGKPKNMQNQPSYEHVTLDIAKSFSQKINTLKELAVHDVILDPGFGFGKTTEHNYQLLRDLNYFNKLFDLPILVGLSRKGMIWKALNVSPMEALNGTTAAHMVALINGANILRVHDVAAAKEAITIYHQTYPNV